VRWAPWIDACEGRTQPVRFGTEHLPAEVVNNEFLFAIDCRSSEEESKPGRKFGGAWVSLNFGGRENPELSADELEYVLAVVRFALGGKPVVLRPPVKRLPGIDR
jgi:hypothetical protein